MLQVLELLLHLIMIVFQYTCLDTNIIVLYYYFIFIIYPHIYSSMYKAPSLIWTVSGKLFLPQLPLQFIRKCH